jgi:undecaprenyl-diphosphatase
MTTQMNLVPLPPELDRPVRRLSNAANYSRLGWGMAAAIAVLSRRHGRRATLE